MKEQIIEIIKSKGQGTNELVFEFEIPNVSKFNSVELYDGDKIRFNRWYNCDGVDHEQQLDWSQLTTELEQEVVGIIKEKLDI